MRTKGKIASWNEEKGYGFIEPVSGGKQIFIHIKAFKNRSRLPVLGQIVTYSISTDKQGRSCAVDATCAGDKPVKETSSGIASITMAIIFIAIVGVSVLAGKLPSVVIWIYLALTAVTFLAYAFDKSAAKRGSWRTQESTLHLFALAGGWPGALIAQQVLRHKSKKESFRLVYWMTVLLNIGGFIWLLTPAGAKTLNVFLQSATWG